jgi:hypothetical protein
MHEGFATCGANAYRIDHVVSVRELIRELVDECRLHLEPTELDIRVHNTPSL